MRKVTLAIILPLLISQSAFAAPQSALAPGKPAGIKKAQDQDVSTPLLVYGRCGDRHRYRACGLR